MGQDACGRCVRRERYAVERGGGGDNDKYIQERIRARIKTTNPFPPRPRSTGASHPRGKRQVPGQARSVVQVLSIKVGSGQPLPRPHGINQGQIRIQDPPPAPGHIVDGIRAAVAEVRVPLLGHEVLVPDVRAGRVDGDHVDPLDVLVVGAKVRRVVDFVLEQDAGVFVADEVCGLVRVGGFEEEVVLESTFLDGQHQIPAGFHGRVADGAAPHFEGITEQGVFGRGFLVLSWIITSESVLVV